MQYTKEELEQILAEARALNAAGKAVEAVKVAGQVPDAGAGAYPHLEAGLSLELLRGYTACAEEDGDETFRLGCLSHGQKAFYRCVYIDPHCHEAYCLQARLFSALGRKDRAVQLLNSIQFSSPNDSCAALLQNFKTPTTPTAAPDIPVSADNPMPGARILMLMMDCYDPALDVLYDGLCQVAGAEQVVEYPFKPMLHGQDAEQADQYPTTCCHPGTDHGLDWICDRLREGYFDLILYGDVLNCIPEKDIQDIMEAAGEIPLFLVDGWDPPSNNQAVLLEQIGRPSARAYFKREMIAGVDYGPDAFSLPLSYPDSRVPSPLPAQRSEVLFWAGNRYYGLRRLYLSHLETELGLSLDHKYTQAEYAAALDKAMIGLSLHGFGYDTVRYWEVPAHGAVLLAEHPPIVIPNDFTDGKNALFFDDLPGLLERLEWSLTHPEALPAMAVAGHQHFLAYHTGSARARQLLGHVRDRMMV